jgi:hypothetical protein
LRQAIAPHDNNVNAANVASAAFRFEFTVENCSIGAAQPHRR